MFFAFSKASFLRFLCEAFKFNIRSRDLRNVSPSQLQQCAGSNMVGLVGTLLAFCLYCYSLSTLPHAPCAVIQNGYNYHRRWARFDCPTQVMEVSWLLLWSPFTVLTYGNFAEELCRGTKCAVVSFLQAYNWSVLLMLLLYNIGAIFLHGILSLSAIKTLKVTWNTFLSIQ